MGQGPRGYKHSELYAAAGFSDCYAIAAFQTELTELRDEYKTVVTAENDARIGRKKRDALL